MPGEQNRPDVTHDQVVRDTLELFCSSSEQTYEDFLTSFPHLLTGDTANGHLAGVSGFLPFCQRDGVGAEPGGRSENESNHEPLGKESEVEHQDELENDSAVPDFTCEEEERSCTSGQSSLPGEVDEALATYAPSFFHHTRLEFHTIVPGERLPKGSVSESEADTEVLPFCLDENFDYDLITPSHKHPWIRNACNVHPSQRFSGCGSEHR